MIIRKKTSIPTTPPPAEYHSPIDSPNNRGDLTCVEKAFLKKIINQPVKNPYIAGYWEWQYCIKHEELIEKLLSNGYLIITNAIDNLNYMTIPELKNVLRQANLKVSGNKQNLIKRINVNIAKNDLCNYVTDLKERYTITENGFKEIENLPDSITKDIDFENEVLQIINNGDLDTAYRKVAEWRGLHPDGSIEIDWFEEAKRGISESDLSFYKYVLGETQGIEKLYREATVLCLMLGWGPFKANILITRLVNKIEGKYFLSAIQSYYEGRQISTLNSYKKSGYKHYQILTAEDDYVCEKCRAFNRKIFLVEDAQIGVNFPPFHNCCVCTTIFWDEDTEWWRKKIANLNLDK